MLHLKHVFEDEVGEEWGKIVETELEACLEMSRRIGYEELVNGAIARSSQEGIVGMMVHHDAGANDDDLAHNRWPIQMSQAVCHEATIAMAAYQDAFLLLLFCSCSSEDTTFLEGLIDAVCLENL